MDEEDLREVELSTIGAIYPEELTINDKNPFEFTIEIPVSLSSPVVVNFPAASEAAPLISGQPVASELQAHSVVDSQELSNLPALQVHVTLPEDYPQEKPPNVVLTTSPPWLSDEILKKLESDAERLWEEIGHDQVVFAYIEDVRQSADTVFGLVNESRTLKIEQDHKIAILDYDIKAKRKAFERESFDCGICLDPKKGSVCHRMLDCGHVFCIQCLQDFYNNAITEGDVSSVQCLEPSCAKKRNAAAREAGGSKRQKLKSFISPSELLQIPLESDMVKRYVTLKHKTELESDKNTVYCPRSWCQGAARSKKHKKPVGLEFAQDSEDESEHEEPKEPERKKKEISKGLASDDLLAICEDCGFAFCARCGQSWHGEFKYCMPKERKDEITEEEKASLEYMAHHTTPCPTCAAPCQKTQGCNHMRCFRCQTHFCYLCSAWLNPENPYQHFNVQPSGEVNGCFMRLWELEGGDGGDVGIEYAGGEALPNAIVEPGRYGQNLEIVEQIENESDDGDSEEEDGEELLLPMQPQQQPPPQEEARGQAERGNARIAVAREGPLVLRIEGNALPARGRGQGHHQPAPAPAAGRGGPQALNAGPRGGRGNRGQRGQGAGRQINRGRMPGQNQAADRNGRNGQNGEMDEVLVEGRLNHVDEAWVRHFVQLALNDQEHLVMGLGDEDED